MDFIADQRAERAIDELVALYRPLAVEFGRNDNGLKMSVVTTHNLHDGAIEACFYELCDLCGIHICVSYATLRDHKTLCSATHLKSSAA